jgi:hypothetical protein
MQVAYDKQRIAYEAAVAEVQASREQTLTGYSPERATPQSRPSTPLTSLSTASDAAGAHSPSRFSLILPDMLCFAMLSSLNMPVLKLVYLLTCITFFVLRLPEEAPLKVELR